MTYHRPIRRAVFALAAAAALGGCALLRTPEPLTIDTAYTQGMEAFQAGRHRRAAELLTQFVTSTGADPRLKGALVALATSHFAMREYVSAASDYLRIVTEFPTDPEARDARFGMCRAYHELSPRPQLDPEYTTAAISYCESYASIYPGTPDARQAQEWVGEMRDKLAEKAYQTGFFYYRRGLYDASIVYFNDVLAQYPQSEWAPAALNQLMLAYGRMGYREEEAATRQRLLTQYPQSAQARALAAAPADSAGG